MNVRRREGLRVRDIRSGTTPTVQDAVTTCRKSVLATLSKEGYADNQPERGQQNRYPSACVENGRFIEPYAYDEDGRRLESLYLGVCHEDKIAET